MRKVYFQRTPRDWSRNRSTVFAVPRLNAAYSAANPWRSLGMACHPHQVQQFNELYRSQGIVSAYHEADGTLVAESKQARNQVLKSRGLRDNDAGYGDWAGHH